MTIAYGDAIRSEMLIGVDILANAVKITLGPKGRNVAMHQKANVYGADYGDAELPDAPVLVTNDGVTIAKSIELPDRMQNMGVMLCKESAIRANDEAGDGTTTAIVLAQSLLHGAFRSIAAGADPLALRRGVQAAAQEIISALRDMAVLVNSEEDLARVATISCQDPQLGAMIGKAMHDVGLEGVVNVDDSRRFETTLEVQEGAVFDRGFQTPHMATDRARVTAELRNPYILLADMKFSNAQDIIPALILAAEDERDILVISDGVEGDALATVLGNNAQGGMHVVCVTGPGYGEGRRWRMEDLAILTGGMFMTRELGLSVRDVSRAELGQAEYVKVTSKRTTIGAGAGNPQQIANRVAELRSLVEDTDYDFNRKRHQERLATFVSGIATIFVGGATEPEQWECKMRVEDAVNAVRAAFEEGIVAGGGTALVDAIPRLQDLAQRVSGDERTGVEIAIAACKAPMAQIAENAGREGSVVLAKVMESFAGVGYDASADRYVNMIEAGIIDPLRVTRSAVQAAFSLAGTAMLTEAGVTETVSSKQSSG